MRKIGYAAACAAIVAFSTALLTAAGPALDRGALKTATCAPGKVVINVTQSIINDADSGVAGNMWALDDFVRHIAVVQTGPHRFCAIVRYEGSFTTLPGVSPGGSGTVDGGIDGTIQGGYVTEPFTATLKDQPLARTRGNIGTYDYACTGVDDCPGAVSWPSLYFDDGVGFEYAWWGWIYHAGHHGTWVNAVDGNLGDITGS